MADFFEIQLLILIALCVVAILFERYGLNSESKGDASANGQTKDEDDETHLGGLSTAAHSLGMTYLVVYAIVMGADWLQGPYVYSLYREQYKFSEREVAVLFVTGFIAAGTSGPFVGVWADQYGRKRLCSIFCLTYAGSCLLIQQTLFPLLLIGRLFGGVSTAILFSCFESWLVAAYQGLPSALALSANAPGVKQAVSRTLSRTMGRASLVNGIVAALAGVVSNWVVGYTQSNRGPFILSGILLILAWIVIGGRWEENYGSGGTGTMAVAGGEIAKLKQAVRIVWNEPAFLVLGFIQTCFEGSMYLFVFLWVPSLQEAGGMSLPLGYIFSAFMISMMLGSIIYTTIATTYKAPSTDSSLPSNENGQGEPPRSHTEALISLHAKLATAILGVAALLFAYSATGANLAVEKRFWAFCAFEACVGAYYPVMGMLRGTLVANEVRATLSSLFRMPLNIFVTVALLTGVSSARHLVFTGCALLLALAAVACAVVLLRRRENHVAPAEDSVPLTTVNPAADDEERTYTD